MTTRRRISSLSIAALLFAVAMPAEAVVYHGIRNQSGNSRVLLEITTDGTLGTLSAANILYFSATFQGLDEMDIQNYGRNPSIKSSTVALTGSSLTATAGRLFFDFDNGNGLFGVNNRPFYLFTSANCGCSFQSPVEFYELDSEFNFRDFQSGRQALGAVPEPASWAMMIAGFGLTGAMLRRRRARGANRLAAAG